MTTSSVYVLIIVVCLSGFSTGNAQTNGDRLKKLLASKDVGNTLFTMYRSMLLSQNLSSVLQQTMAFINYQCLKDLSDLSNTTKLQYIDAAGKPHSGIYFGNTLWLGSVNECQNISNTHYSLSTFTLSFLKMLPLSWSACFPSSCTPNNIALFLEQTIFPMVEKKVKVNITLIGKPICPAEPSYTTGVIVTLVISGIILFCCLLGTILDLIIEAYDNYKTNHAITSCPSNTVEQHNVFQAEGMNSGGLPQACKNDEGGGGNYTATHPADNQPILFQTPSEPQIFLSTLTASPPILQDSSFDTGMLCSDIQNDSFHKRGTAAILNSDEREQLINKTLNKEPLILRVLCDFLLCFSLVRNTKKIFNTNVPSTAITSINGIRVISITWVILGHTYLTIISTPLIVDKVQLYSFDSSRLSIMPVINAYYSVDNFFFLSGLLVAYTCMRKMQKSNGKFNWLLFYVHRFFRLTPAYMYVILFSLYLKRFLATGPFYYTLYEDKACSKYWWTNLIYINNFYPNDVAGCLPWTWYLANNMQFFLITPPLLFILYRYGWKALVIPLSLIGCSSIVIASIVGYYGLDPFGIMKLMRSILTGLTSSQTKKVTEYQRYVYNTPYCRIQPYLVGFILGYAIFKNFIWMRKPKWAVTIAGWIVSFVVGMLLVYGPYDYISPNSTQFNQAEKVLYAMFERLIWGLVMAWVTYACHYHAGGLVQKILSAKFWIPLSRLTYSVYLIHFIVLPAIFIGALGTIQYDTTTVVYYFISTVVLSYGAAFILSISIEFPCDNLENMVIKYVSKR